MRDIRSLKERWLVGFENAEREKQTLESPRGSEDVSIGEGEQGLVSCEECVQPVAEKSENASFEEVMNGCDDESMCEEVVQIESLCDDVSDDIGFLANLLSEAGVNVSTFYTSMLEDVTCEFFDRLLDEKVPLEKDIDAPKNDDTCADAVNMFRGFVFHFAGMYAFQCLLKATDSSHAIATGVS
ncbi:hypothetical protein GOP47_0024981 [Adiantum capillus-veneris]|uniref:Uncharacterized protein n=1 Tax=Adiantum capillus-veneris TaxID=13818 RepID=A0A9D4U2T7_ADICA|nr:hypothetical protein GOP47_0030843 [Adiantum capillus-veneris]KAI5060561.1 hypothetical protein GOP47_0024981 [Adiantum capillus-veneris]